MKTKQEKKYIVCALIAFIGFVYIARFWIPITYAVNDDTTMKSIASGAMSGTPDGHLIFVQYILGAVIAGLYKCYNGIDWYGSSMLAIVLISVFAFIYRSSKLFKQNYIFGIISVLSVFVVVIFEHFVNFQFTVVSAIAAAAAIFFYNTIDPTDKCYQWDYVVVLLLAWLSYCVRYDTFIMALPFAGVSLLFKKVKWNEKIIVGTILFIGLLAIVLIENRAYSAAEWQAYKRYNIDRSTVYDYYDVPDYEQNKELYDSLDMSSYDVENLSNYNLYMIEGIEAGKIQKIAAYSETEWMEGTSLTTRISEAFRVLKKGYFQNRTILVNILAKLIIVANVWFEIKNRKRTIWLNILFVFIEIVLAFYLGYQGRILTRVMSALFCIEFFSALSIWCDEHYIEMPNLIECKLSKFVLACMVALSVWMFFEIKENQQNTYQENVEAEQLYSYFQSNPNNVYLMNAYDIWFYTDNFEVFEEFKVKNFLKLGEWSSFSPVETTEIERYGIKKVDDSLINNNKIFLVYKKPSEAITDHYLEKYRNIEWVKIDEIQISQEKVPVYRLNGF